MQANLNKVNHYKPRELRGRVESSQKSFWGDGNLCLHCGDGYMVTLVKLIELYTENWWNLLYVNYTSMEFPFKIEKKEAT